MKMTGLRISAVTGVAAVALAVILYASALLAVCTQGSGITDTYDERCHLANCSYCTYKVTYTYHVRGMSGESYNQCDNYTTQSYSYSGNCSCKPSNSSTTTHCEG